MTYWFNKKKKKLDVEDAARDLAYKEMLADRKIAEQENITKMFDKQLLSSIEDSIVTKELQEFESKFKYKKPDSTYKGIENTPYPFYKDPDFTGSIWTGTEAPRDDTLPFPKFLMGQTYKQINGEYVLILGMSNFGTKNETVYAMDGKGKVIHRYNRRDFGRVTGSSTSVPDPRNLEVIDHG